MRTYYEITKEMVNEGKKVIDMYITKTMDSEMIKYMDPEDLELMQESMKMMDKFTGLALEQARINDSMNEKLNMMNKKLDKLLAKK